MRTSELKFYKQNLMKFCEERGFRILNDIYKMPTISRKNSFVSGAKKAFDESVQEFKGSFTKMENVVFFIDSIDNMKNLIPSVTISVVGTQSFLIYDVILKRFYTYENNIILLNDKQICIDDIDTNVDSFQCESMRVCRYLLGLSKNIVLSDNSPFATFCNINNNQNNNIENNQNSNNFIDLM
jgi:hypothetical protein